MDNKPVSLDVIWSEEWEAWGVLKMDAEGNQIGEGQWWAYQDRAVDDAIIAMNDNPTIKTLKVYTKTGKLKREDTRERLVPSRFHPEDYPHTDDTRVPAGSSAKQAMIHLITQLEALNRLQVRGPHHEYETYMERRRHVRFAILHFMNLAIDEKDNLLLMDGFDHYL